MPGAVCLLLYAYRFGVRPVVLLPHHHDQLVGHAGVAHACGKHAAKRQLGRVVAQVDDGHARLRQVKRVVVLHLAGHQHIGVVGKRQLARGAGRARARDHARNGAVEIAPHARGAAEHAGATRGKLNEDSKFADNYTGAKDAGVKVGIYFFSQATSVTEAEEEAGYVLQLLQNKSVDYPVVFDWEQTSVDGSRTADATGEQITSYASAFCKKIAKAGYTAGVYFNRSLGYNYYDLEQLKDFEFWLAEYRSVPAFYYNFGLWQYSDNAQVQGIDAAVDINVSFKNYG